MAVAIDNLAKHQFFTFDVWNTLIVANLEFSRLRTEAIAEAYGVTFEEAKEAYTSVKFFLDQSAEIASICMSTPQCWQLLDVTIERIRRKKGLNKAYRVDRKALSEKCNELFKANLPILTEGTKDVLRRLKASGKSMGIISNTNFIPGSLLYSELFAELEVFDATLFSDDYGHPKPRHNTFNHIMYRLQREDDEHGHPTIVHVGDNLICDGFAVRYGYNFQHVDNPDNLVEIFKSVGL